MQRMQGWTGRTDRVPVAIEAKVELNDGSKLPVRVSNMSEEGCRVETDHMLRIGERLRISVPRLGVLDAQVRWALPGAAGTRFLTDDDY